MNLLEHEAKQLLREAKIPVPYSVVIDRNTKQAPLLPVVLKSQVPVGGRGKAGGIIIVRKDEEFLPAMEKIFNLPIKGHLPDVVLAEDLALIDRELYLSMLIDRSEMAIKVVAHTNGGMEVEDNTDFKRWTINGPQDAETIGQALADYYDLPEKAFFLQDLVENLYNCFVSNDATLIEINPLLVSPMGNIGAGDAKIILDDAAAFRHDWKFSDQPAETNFVTINPDGNVATIANGAGLAMATVDAASDAGLSPANFLDIGGGANTETLLAAFNRIVEYPNLQAIIINIFAGITRADEVAKAIVAARDQITDLPPLFIRIAGTNYEAAKEILDAHSITLEATLEDCLSAAREVVHG